MMSSMIFHARRPSRAESRVGAIALLMAFGAPMTAQAQTARGADASSDMSRLIGLSVAASGGPRDTLGLLIASVTRDGPADQAGITTGSRILAVNGLQVRLAPSDIGRRAAADSALVKFDRALRVTPPGRDVMLRVAGGGMTRLVNVPVGGDRRGGTVRVSSPAVVADVAPPADSNAPRGVASAPTVAPTVSAPPTPVRAATAVDALSVPVIAVPASPSSSAVAPSAVREPRSVGTLADALGDMQLELRRLARDSHSLAMSDSLAELDAAVGALRRRMRTIVPDAPSAAAITPPVVNVPAPVSAAAPIGVSAAKVAAGGTATRLGAPGLELARVSGELAAYLGAQGDSALSVVRATEAWEPMHTGDVIIQVDGAAPDADRLRAALESRRRTSVTLLRRGRSFTVLLGDSDAR